MQDSKRDKETYERSDGQKVSMYTIRASHMAIEPKYSTEHGRSSANS